MATFREWLIDRLEKLNPAQPSIQAVESESPPESIRDFKTAYEEIDVITRAIELMVSASQANPLPHLTHIHPTIALALHGDSADGRPHIPTQDGDQSGFPGAVGPYDRTATPGCDLQINLRKDRLTRAHQAHAFEINGNGIHLVTTCLC